MKRNRIVNRNNAVPLNPHLMEKLRKMKPIDIVVGILCKNVETTILHVLNVVSEGLHKYFPEYKKIMAISDGFSSDRTVELANLFQPYNGIEKIVTEDIVEGGKGAGVKTIIEIAHETEAKSIILVDGDLLSIKPEWIQEFSYPILYGRADLIIPYYIRDKYDGVITNHLAYPFTRALYGLDIRQPLAGEFGISKNLYEILREHPLFPYDFGIDIFVVTSAAAEGMEIKEGIYSFKIHESTTRYLEPETLLIPMFRQVTGRMFELAKYYENCWKSKERDVYKTQHRECIAQKPIPVKVDINKLKESFRKEFSSSRKGLKNLLPEDMMIKLEGVTKKIDHFSPELWAEIVYTFASLYKNAKKKSEKYILLDSLKTIWLGRFLSFVMETKDTDLNEAERLIQNQARIFEEKFDYFRSIY